VTGTSFTVAREELYRLVWAQPRVELARTLGISDVAVTKWCRKLRIPVPARGYWAKLAAGQKLPVPPLAKIAGLPERIHIRPQTKSSPVEKVEPVFPIDVRVREVVPTAQTSSRPHPLVTATRQELNKNRVDQHGMQWSNIYSQDCIPMTVSQAQSARALRILDALLNELVRLGATFKRSRDGEHPIVVDGTDVALSMREGYRQFCLTDEQIAENMKRDKYSYGRFRFEPTGKLEIKVEAPAAGIYHTWREGKVALEAQLAEVVSAFLKAPVEAKRRAEAKRLEDQQRWEEQKRRWELEEARKAEQEARAALISEASAWRSWQCVSAYLQALGEAIDREQTSLPQAGREWLSKAKERAVALNPLPMRISQLAAGEEPESDEEIP
jgi:hypothetical protein